MPNFNYQAGVRLERRVMKELNREGYDTSRTAGSHGKFDVYALRTNAPVLVVQCKRVKTEADARRLIERFRDDPPLTPSRFFHQRLAVYITDTRTLTGTTV